MKRILSLVMVFVLVLSSFSFGAAKVSTTFKSVGEVYGVYMDSYNYCYYVVDKKGAKSYTKIYGSDQYYKPAIGSEPQSKWITKDKKAVEVYFGKRTSDDFELLSFKKGSKGQISVRFDVIDGFSTEFKKFKSEDELKKYLKNSQSFKKKVKEEADEIKAEAAKKELYKTRKAEAEKLLSDKNPLNGQYVSKEGAIIAFDGIKSISVTVGDVSYLFERQPYEGKEVPNRYEYEPYAEGEEVIYLSYGRYLDKDMNDFDLQLIYDSKTLSFKVLNYYSVGDISNSLVDKEFKKTDK